MTVLVVTAGCASIPGTPVARDWTGSPVFAALRSVPSTAESRYEIGFVDTRALNTAAAAGGRMLPTTAPRTGLRPQSEYGWTNLSIGGSVCGFAEAQAATPAGFRTGPPGDLLTIYTDGNDLTGSIGVCQGEVDPTELPNGEPATVAGVSGVSIGQVWMGQQRDLLFQLGTKVPADLQQALLAGTATESSLAEDPAVLAVLAANPRAAAVEMGTVFLGLGRMAGNRGDLYELLQASGASLPTPTFAGYGWTPTSGIIGTGTFVTVYASEAEATTAAATLTGLWPRADTSVFSTAVTTSEGTTVVTRVPGVDARDFNFRTLRLAEYPGYGTRRP